MNTLSAGGKPRCFALVPCAGTGSRAGAALPKQYAPLLGLPLVAHTLQALARVPQVEATLVVLAPDDATFAQLLPQWVERTGGAGRCWQAAVGGNTRAQTVCNGLQALQARGAQPHDWVLVHDAARCLLQPQWVERLIEACRDDAVGGLLALPLSDTLKADDGAAPDQARVAGTVSRQGKWAAQTPQMFRLGLLLPALRAALATPAGAHAITDEASAIEAAGHAPRLVPGDATNLKVTYPADFALAERLLRSAAPAAAPAVGSAPGAAPEVATATAPAPAPLQPAAAPPALRIGEGWDVHQLVAGRPLVLGGVTIPHSHGLLGHSDADALLHAITDALFGAAALGDIGRHFPDTDAAFKGADSALLLAEAGQRVAAAGWRIANIDSTIVAQAPKLAPHIPAMVQRIAQLLGLQPAQVNVKAKTAERLGPVGEGRAMEARAVCLLHAAPAPGPV